MTEKQEEKTERRRSRNIRRFLNTGIIELSIIKAEVLI
jgi:hypothetical protein